MEIREVDIESRAVICKCWCRNFENYTCVNIVGDSIHLILESGIIVATNQTNKDPKPWPGKRPPFEHTAA